RPATRIRYICISSRSPPCGGVAIPRVEGYSQSEFGARQFAMERFAKKFSALQNLPRRQRGAVLTPLTRTGSTTMMKKTLAAALACAFAAPAMAQSAGVAGGFSKGKTHVFATAGSGHAFDESYLVLGLGVSYYLFDGFNVGLSYESWTGSDPKITKI